MEMENSTFSLNLLFRFLLELAALAAFGYWGWQTGEGWTRYLLAILAPVVGALIWGTFAVPDDPSRSGKAPVPIHGWLRLILELAVFGLASGALLSTGQISPGIILGFLVIVHYVLSIDRIRWLIQQGIK